MTPKRIGKPSIKGCEVKNVDGVFIRPDNNDVDTHSLRVSWRLLKCVTPIRYSRFCSDQIHKILGTTDVHITDACGGNGGDTITFAHTFTSVHTLEVDPQEFRILKNNVQTYKLSNVTLQNQSAVTYLRNHAARKSGGDVLYLDPPWGEDYKKYYKMHLYLDNINIIDIVHDANFYLTVIKVPYNYKYRELDSYLSQRGCIVWRKPVRNYYLIFIKKPWIFSPVRLIIPNNCIDDTETESLPDSFPRDRYLDLPEEDADYKPP